MIVKVKKLRPEAVIPQYAHTGDAGMDVCNAGPDIKLAPQSRCLAPTGLSVEIPPGYELQVRPRSGLALKKGLTVLNTPGTIDAGYRGEIGVILFNSDPRAEAEIKHGERVAQIVLNKVEIIEWEESGALEASSREAGGFGSTGSHILNKR